ncbi:MAG TPA: hypothetical protein VMX55_07290 [candidate division Zixibacteria bacterium]|nr:hypothetical protein [candidate division Zixibacteria bacterium]
MNYHNGNNNDKNNGILHIHSDNCDKCHKSIEVSIKRSDRNSAIGGIFRIVIIHQCLTEKIVIMFFFDDFFVLRQKVSIPVSNSDLKEEDYLDRASLKNTKKFAGFKFLYKRLRSDFAKAIFGVLVGQQIVIAGEEHEVKASCIAISSFTEHRISFIDDWTQDRSDADIVGTQTAFIGLYPEAVIIDLETQKVLNGSLNLYCANLIEELMQSKNEKEYEKKIQDTINLLLTYTQEYSVVLNTDEASDFLTSLAIDGIEQDLLEIILALTAQINPNVGFYYRKYLDIIQYDSLDILEPLSIWIYENDFIDSRKITYRSRDIPYNLREQKFIERMNKITKHTELKQEVVEFITPLYYFVTIFGKNTNIIFCYPRIPSTEKQFISSLNIFEELIEKSNTNDLLTVYLSDFIKEKLDNSKTESRLTSHKEKDLVTIKRTLSKTREYSLLERHYIRSNIREKNLRMLIEELTKQISLKIPNIDPKIIQQNNRFVISETITNIPIFGSSIDEKMDLGFSINIILDEKKKNEPLVIVLSFYLKKYSSKFGIEINSILVKLYEKFNEIIKQAIIKVSE